MNICTSGIAVGDYKGWEQKAVTQLLSNVNCLSGAILGVIAIVQTKGYPG